jgi:hypothetical protein
MPLRYVWVNEKLNPMVAFCAYDHVQLREGYVREFSTKLLYHDNLCLGQHALECQEVMAQAKVS